MVMKVKMRMVQLEYRMQSLDLSNLTFAFKYEILLKIFQSLKDTFAVEVLLTIRVYQKRGDARFARTEGAITT